MSIRSEAALKKGDFDKAVADCSESVRLNPQNAVAYSDRPLAYLQKGDLKKSLTDWNKAVELPPKLSEAYLGRAIAGIASGESNSALSDYQAAKDMNPNCAEEFKAWITPDSKVDVDENLKKLQELADLKVSGKPGRESPTSPGALMNPPEMKNSWSSPGDSASGCERPASPPASINARRRWPTRGSRPYPHRSALFGLRPLRGGRGGVSPGVPRDRARASRVAEALHARAAGAAAADRVCRPGRAEGHGRRRGRGRTLCRRRSLRGRQFR